VNLQEERLANLPKDTGEEVNIPSELQTDEVISESEVVEKAPVDKKATRKKITV